MYFSTPWQERLLHKETAARIAKIYRNKFSEHDDERVKEVLAELVTHPNRSMLISFLQANDLFEL